MSEAASVLAGPSPTTGAEATTGQAAAPVETVTQAPEGLPDWAKDFSPAAQNVIAAKKWAKPEQAVESYANLEKLLGGDKIALPKDADDPAWADVWKKLGAFEKPDEYAGMVKPAEGAPELDPGFVGAMSDLAAKAKLTPAQWATMVEGYQALSKAAQEADSGADAEAQATLERDVTALKAKLGKDYDAYVADAQRAGLAVKMTPEESAAFVSALGYTRAMEIMNGLGSKFGKEAGYIEGKGPQGQMTPEMARAKVNELLADPVFARAYGNGGHKEVKEITDLHIIIAGQAP